jgi:hypothetical protein
VTERTGGHKAAALHCSRDSGLPPFGSPPAPGASILLPGERKRAKVAAALEGYSDDAVWAEIERHRGGSSSAPSKTIKQAEIETLLASPDAIGQDKIEGDFYARRWRPEPPLHAIWTKLIVSFSSTGCAK